MDVGVEPVAVWAETFPTQSLNAHETTGSTADMEQEFHKKSPPYIFYTKLGVF
jgi:hypothetical protein